MTKLQITKSRNIRLGSIRTETAGSLKRHRLIMLVCLALISVFTSEIYSDTGAGEILTVKNEVYMIRNEQRSDARPQMPLLLKDAVETGKKSRTKLFFKDDSILNLGELSKVEVEEYLYSPEKKRSRSIYRLIDGSLKVIVGRSDLEIHTPTAVAAARGTKFIIWAEGSGDSARTCAMVFDGEVILKNIKKDIRGTVTVKGGTMSCVPIAKSPEPVTSISSEEQKKFTDRTVVAGDILEDRGELPIRPAVQISDRAMSEMSELSGLGGSPPVMQEPAGDITPVTIEIIFP